MGQYLIDTNTAVDFLDDKLPEKSKRACGQVAGPPVRVFETPLPERQPI